LFIFFGWCPLAPSSDQFPALCLGERGALEKDKTLFPNLCIH
jgi:hypothetical protein